MRMISEVSWDNEDWGNDAENTALHHMTKLDIQIDNSLKL